MEELPPEMVQQVVRYVESPESLINLSVSAPVFRDVLPSLIPLVLPAGYVLDWNTFASSPYSQIQGEGSIQAPQDLSKAARRIRGNLQLTLRPEVYKTKVHDVPVYRWDPPGKPYIFYTESYPHDILSLLRIRGLLYPSSRFLIRGPDGETIVEWQNPNLTLNLEWRDWEKVEEMRALSEP